ncbi:MAG: redoxin domain-containing protein, partial [Candidatus Desulforudis sp.]|nr:redoxin domain-containing protein [Desulforudis sp.]
MNCIHVLPELQALEDRFGPGLQIISVHSAKFPNEKVTDEIQAAMRRYGIRHPVINDRDFQVWRHYAVRAWPTLVLIDPQGYIFYVTSGEGNEELLERLIADTLAHFGDGRPKPSDIPAFDLGTSNLALAYPGKVAFDPETRLIAVAESFGHRVILVQADGTILRVAGNGQAGYEDGVLSAARFNEPQGMAFHQG